MALVRVYLCCINTTLATQLDYGPLVAECRAVFKTGRTKQLEWRKKQLRGMMEMIEKHHEAFTEAARADLKGPKIRGLAELGAHGKAKLAIESLDKWAAPEKVKHDGWLGSSHIRKEPKGVVRIPCPVPTRLAQAAGGSRSACRSERARHTPSTTRNPPARTSVSGPGGRPTASCPAPPLRRCAAPAGLANCALELPD